MKTITFYTLSDYYDKTSNIIGRFANKTDAEAIKGQLPQSDYTETTLTIFESVDDFHAAAKQKILDNILSKLTDAEKAMVNISIK